MKVKAFIITLLCGLMSIYSSAQERNVPIHEIDYDDIEKFYRDSTDAYNALWKHFKEADKELSFEDLAYLYYGYTYSKDYFGYYHIDNDKFFTMLGDLKKPNKRKAAKAMKYAEKEMAKAPFNLEATSHAMLAAYLLGDEVKTKRYAVQSQALIYVITLSGDGESRETAYHTIYVADEYYYLESQCKYDQRVNQSFDGICDKIVFKDENGEEHVKFFDVSRPISRLNEMVNK